MIPTSAYGVLIENNSVLLLLRKSKSFNNMWTNPGGKIDEGETPEETVRREVKEEAGIEAKVIKKLLDYPYQMGDNLRVFSGYLVERVNGNPYNTDPESHSDLRYFPLNNLPDNITPYTKAHILKFLEQN